MTRLTKIGITLTVLLAIVWAASIFIGIGYEWPNRGIHIWSGSVGFDHWMPPFPPPYSGGFWVQRSAFVYWKPERRRVAPMGTAPGGHVAYLTSVPLWLPLAALALPTMFLIVRDRRRRFGRGHCRKCGYDLTGNVSGVCPECGKRV